jgi:hypothetical protein
MVFLPLDYWVYCAWAEEIYQYFHPIFLRFLVKHDPFGGIRNESFARDVISPSLPNAPFPPRRDGRLVGDPRLRQK